MVQNSKFAIMLLEKIGAPLAAAIQSAPPADDETGEEAAKVMAQMMGQAVQASITLNASLNVTENEEQADSTRLALAALMAPLIADFYVTNKKLPEDQDMKRLIKMQEAVLSFSENFTPAQEGQSRLTTIDHDAPLYDATQSTLVAMQIMTPVIQAIAEFPFGQGEIKLQQSVMERLKADADQIAPDKNNGLAQMMGVKALAEIYAACHRAETAKLSAMDDSDRGELSFDPVWTAYETRLSMVQAMMGSDSEAQNATPAVPSKETPPEQAAAPPAEEKPAEAAPASPPAGGPMGFFKPGVKTEDTPAEPTAETPPVAESAAETPPPAEPTAAPPAEPTAETPPTAPDTPPSDPPAASPSSPPSSPMGFFKPGVKKKEDGEGDDAASGSDA